MKSKTLDSNNVPNDVFSDDLHIELWDWLAKNPGKEKSDWPRWWYKQGDVPYMMSSCFACQFDSDNSPRFLQCESCPFGNFSNNHDRTDMERCLNGIFLKWTFCDSNAEKTKFAKQIRDFPLRKDWQWEDVVVK